MNRLLISCFVILLCSQSLFAESLYQNSKKGKEAFEKGQYEKALDRYTAAQLEAPDNVEVFYNLGNTQYKTGDFDSALNNYSKVLSTDKKELKQKAIYNIGNTYFRKGDYEEAIKQYKKALKLNPNDNDAKKNIEFVKKVIEQQKQQKENNQDKDKQNKDKQNKDKQNKDKQNKDKQNKDKQNKDKQNKDKQNKDKQNKDKQNKDKQNKDKQNKSQQKQKQDKPEQKPDEQRQNQQQEKANKQKEDKDKKQAERMLNRLQDNPGRAMMPVYQNKNVEKDW